MRPYIFSFKVGGVIVRAEPSWLFLALLIGWSLASGFFPAQLEGLETWKSEDIKASIMSLAQARDLKPGKVMQPLRAALTGGMPSGDLAETLEILGQVESIARLRDQAAA